MSRKIRLDPPGGRHHVMNRGARRAPVFEDDDTALLFLGALADLPHRFGIAVHAYVLMPNHYHLLMSCPRGNLSEGMRHVGAKFTASANRHHQGWDGPMFRGRFHNRLVEDDVYWMHLLAYLHLNPVRARLATTPERWHWSSHHAYVGAIKPPEWLHVHEHLEMFGTVEAYRGHLRDMMLKRDVEPDDFDAEDLMRPAITRRFPPPATPLPAVRPVKQALADVTEITGIPASTLTATRIGRSGNPAKWLAAWWLARGAGASQTEIARILRSQPVLISRWIGRVGQSAPDDELSVWKDALLERR